MNAPVSMPLKKIFQISHTGAPSFACTWVPGWVGDAF